MPFDHFGLIAGFYDRAAQFTLGEPLLGLISPNPESVALDIGGGTGRLAAALRGRLKEIIVADISFGMLRFAAAKELPAVCAPAERLPFPAGTFGRIVMLDALHHVFSQEETAGELWRLLAPGGRLVIIEPDIRKFPVKLIALAEKLLLMRSHFLDGDRIAALFGNQGALVSVTFHEFNTMILAQKAGG